MPIAAPSEVYIFLKSFNFTRVLLAKEARLCERQIALIALT